MRKKKQEIKKREAVEPEGIQSSAHASTTIEGRYFHENDVDDESASQTRSNIPKAAKTAPTLPDFIKI